MRAKRRSIPPAGADAGEAREAAVRERRKRRLRAPALEPGAGIANMNDEEEAFIAEFIARRLQRVWSQEMLALRAGVSRSTVKHLEHRRRCPSLRVARCIARAFGSGVDEMIEAGLRRRRAARVALVPQAERV